MINVKNRFKRKWRVSAFGVGDRERQFCCNLMFKYWVDKTDGKAIGD